MSRLACAGLDLGIAGRPLVNDLSLDLQPGQCWGLLGPNGAGKTTLLHGLAGLRPLQAGQVTLDGRPLQALPRRHIAQHLGLLPQEDATAFPSSVLDQVLSGRHPHLGPWQWETAEDLALAHHWLDTLDLAACASRLLDTLSGGERRRVAIATLLTQSTDILLLDEPNNHLDLAHQMAVLKLLGELTRQPDRPRTVMMSLHDVNLASRFCDHVLLLFGDGRHLSGPTPEILTRDVLEALYRHPFRMITVEQRNFWLPE